MDGDGDGKRDLFNNIDDVFASVANYFVEEGRLEARRPGDGARDCAMPSAADYSAKDIDADACRSPSFAARGYRRRSAASRRRRRRSVITLDGAGGTEYWMVFRNFHAITRYNTSRLYATAVYQLAEAIAGRDAQVAQQTQQATVPLPPVQAEATPP